MEEHILGYRASSPALHQIILEGGCKGNEKKGGIFVPFRGLGLHFRRLLKRRMNVLAVNKI